MVEPNPGGGGGGGKVNEHSKKRYRCVEKNILENRKLLESMKGF